MGAAPITADDAPFVATQTRGVRGLNSHDNKFGVASKAKRTHPDGTVFSSSSELKVWLELQKRIHPTHLHRQLPFELLPEFTDPEGMKVRAIRWISDIVLGPLPINQNSIVIDVKGMLLPEFILKRKLFLWRYRLPLYLASGSITTGRRKSDKRPKCGVKLSVEAIMEIYQNKWGAHIPTTPINDHSTKAPPVRSRRGAEKKKGGATKGEA